MGIKENARFENLLESIENNRFMSNELNSVYKELNSIIENTFERSDIMHINALCLDHYVNQRLKYRSNRAKFLLDVSYERMFRIS